MSYMGVREHDDFEQAWNTGCISVMRAASGFHCQVIEHRLRELRDVRKSYYGVIVGSTSILCEDKKTY